MNVADGGYRTSPWKWAGTAVAAALLPVMVLASADYGATWDELPRQGYGERIWQYYEGKIDLSRFREDGSGSHLYGGLFEIVAVALQRLIDADPYRVRHGWTAVVGWLGVVFCGVLAARVGGPRAATLAMLLLIVTPPYLGHAMNNPKDVPFATASTAALAVMAAIPAAAPLLTWPRTVTLGVAIGATLAIRPGALLLLGYVAVVLLVQGLRARMTRRQTAVAVGRFVCLVVIATTLPLPFWPWLQREPYLGLLSAVRDVSHFEWRGTTLFLGEDAHSMRLPWSYVPVWLLISMPPVVLAGAAIAVVAARVRPEARIGLLGVVGAVLFPIAYVIARHSTLYDGLRHLLFVVPPLAVAAALGWDALLSSPYRRVVGAAAATLAIGLAEPVVFSARNHPNQIVYFSPLAGGPARAEGRFELDYWGNCLLQAQRHIAAQARAAGMPVVISGHRWRLMGANAGRLPQLAVSRPEAARHHLEILLHRGTRAQIEALRARGDVLHSVETADGARLCSVVPGPAYDQWAARLQR
jgi:hypothetical protein